LAHAARLFGAAESLRERLGAEMMPDERVEYDQALNALRASLGDQAAAFEAAWQAGRALSFEDALALALSAPGR
jgi:hypothetical protein